MASNKESHFTLNQLTKLTFYINEITDTNIRNKASNILYILSKTTQYKKILNDNTLIEKNEKINLKDVVLFNLKILDIKTESFTVPNTNITTNAVLFYDMIKFLIKGLNFYGIKSVYANGSEIILKLNDSTNLKKTVYLVDIFKDSSSPVHMLDLAIFYELAKKLNIKSDFKDDEKSFTLLF